MHGLDCIHNQRLQSLSAILVLGEEDVELSYGVEVNPVPPSTPAYILTAMSDFDPQDWERGRGTGLKTCTRSVPPGRLELPAQGLGIPCSIRLSYGGTICYQWFA